VRIFGLQRHEKERFHDQNQRIYRNAMRAARAHAAALPGNELLGYIGFAVVIWVGMYEIVSGRLTLAWLITLALGIGYSLALILPLLIVGAALVGVGVAVYAVAKIVGVVIYGVLAGMVLLAALLFLNGAFTAYISSYWTLAFRALEYLAAGVPGRPLPQKQ